MTEEFKITSQKYCKKSTVIGGEKDWFLENKGSRTIVPNGWGFGYWNEDYEREYLGFALSKSKAEKIVRTFSQNYTLTEERDRLRKEIKSYKATIEILSDPELREGIEEAIKELPQLSDDPKVWERWRDSLKNCRTLAKGVKTYINALIKERDQEAHDILLSKIKLIKDANKK